MGLANVQRVEASSPSSSGLSLSTDIELPPMSSADLTASPSAMQMPSSPVSPLSPSSAGASLSPSGRRSSHYVAADDRHAHWCANLAKDIEAAGGDLSPGKCPQNIRVTIVSSPSISVSSHNFTPPVYICTRQIESKHDCMIVLSPPLPTASPCALTSSSRLITTLMC